MDETFNSVQKTIVRIPNGVHITNLLIKQIPELLIVVAVLGGDEDAVFVHLSHPGLFQFLVGDIALGWRRQVIGVFLLPGVGIGLVEDDNGLLVGATQFSKGLIHHLHLRLEIGMRDVDHMQKTVQRKNRGKLVRVALVGYTNVGKSTIMNLLSKSEVYTENKLFATLDTTVRKVVVNNLPFLLSDTVGFIRKLPHHLVESF